MVHTINTQDWIDKSVYPFESHFFPSTLGDMHYVDEGKGDILLFVHGTPTWSFLYRDFISHFSKSYRCIAIDHIGFGLSDKPADFDGKPQSHSRNLLEFIEQLNLKDITLVVHDFGGPIGLSAAIAMPERIQRIVMFNTWLWETRSNPEVQKVDKLVNGWLGKKLYLNFNISPRLLFKQAFYDKKKLSPEIHRHYIKPFRNKDQRISLLNLAQSLMGSSDWYELQNSKIGVLENKPWLIIWGMKDRFITPEYLEKWQEIIPHAKVKRLNCGHFIQEEKMQEAVHFIEQFINK